MNKVIKLNLGSGRSLSEGFLNVDFQGSPDIKHNLDKYPYPFKDNSVDYILASHIIEHLEDPDKFLRECHRILKKGGRMKIKTPHVTAWGGAFGTFHHKHHFHEFAIRDVTGHKERSNSQFMNKPFKHIKTIVKRGRFMKWQKREIIWFIEKI